MPPDSMTRFPFLRRAVPALLVGLLFAAAAAAQPAPRALSDRLARAGLDLTADQTTALDAAAAQARAGDRQPGASWSLAADVKALLTPAQIERLMAQRADRREMRGERARGPRAERGRRGRGLRGAQRSLDGESRRAERPQRTDAEREAAREARQAARAEREAITERFRSGAIDAAAFQAQMEQLRERQRAERMAAATPEQRERAAAMRARRDAARAAREAALGLTEAQVRELEAVRLERIRLRPAAPDLRPYLDADGQLDRARVRDARRAQREALAPAMEALRARADAVLTDDQKATLAIQQVLSRGERRAPRGPRSLGR